MCYNRKGLIIIMAHDFAVKTVQSILSLREL